VFNIPLGNGARRIPHDDAAPASPRIAAILGQFRRQYRDANKK